MGSAEDVCDYKAVFDAVKGCGTLDGGLDADLAGVAEFAGHVAECHCWWSPSVREVRVLGSDWRAHVACHAGHGSRPRSALADQRRHLLRLGGVVWRVNGGSVLHLAHAFVAEMKSVIQQGSVNDVPRSVVLGSHTGSVDFRSGRIRVLPLHDIRETVAP